MTAVIEPGEQAPILVVQEEGLPLVVVQPPPADSVVVLQPQPSVVLYVAPVTASPTTVINPTFGGQGGAQPITYSLDAVSSWYQVHPFPYYPQVRLIEDGQEVDIAVEYPVFNAVHLSFPAPFTGHVILS